MIIIIILMIKFFGSLVIGEMSYLTEVANKISEGFIKEIVHPPQDNAISFHLSSLLIQEVINLSEANPFTPRFERSDKQFVELTHLQKTYHLPLNQGVVALQISKRGTKKQQREESKGETNPKPLGLKRDSYT